MAFVEKCSVEDVEMIGGVHRLRQEPGDDDGGGEQQHGAPEQQQHSEMEPRRDEEQRSDTRRQRHRSWEQGAGAIFDQSFDEQSSDDEKAGTGAGTGRVTRSTRAAKDAERVRKGVT